MDCDCSFMFLPYLKTSNPVRFRELTLRSTDDVGDLSEQQVEHVHTLREMFFLRDDLRIKRMSYAIIQRDDRDLGGQTLRQLHELQVVLAYLHSSPHPTSGSLFLAREHVSIYIFTPKRISIRYLEEPYGLENIGTAARPQGDAKDEVDGYEGLLDLRTCLWTARGSRIYPPAGRLSLNESQDLCVLLNWTPDRSPDTPLIRLFREGPQVPERVLTALNWYSRSTAIDEEEEVALVNLAVAFESLLGLEPGDKVTARFRQAVSLLLDGFPRLDSWLTQFYQARSDIVHKGRSASLSFVAVDDPKRTPDSAPMYRSLTSVGRQVFRICMATVLSGASWADELGLPSMLFTNQQRLERICTVLDSANGSPTDRLLAVLDDIRDIDKYVFVPETGLRLETLVGAATRAVAAYLEAEPAVPDGLLGALREFAEGEPGEDHLQALARLRSIQDLRAASGEGFLPDEPAAAAVFLLLDCVWHYALMPYHWLVETRASAKQGGDG